MVGSRMLRGSKVALRARHETDVPVLEAELHDDVATRSRADARPWRPIPPGSAASPYRVADAGGGADDAAHFSVVELPNDELAGDALPGSRPPGPRPPPPPAPPLPPPRLCPLPSPPPHPIL